MSVLRLSTNAGWSRERAAGLLVFVLVLVVPAAALAADPWLDGEPDFLPVDEAFELTLEQGAEGEVIARWQMPDGYYLYRHRFDFQTRSPEGGSENEVVLGEPQIPPGEPKVDEYFGAVEVYYGAAEARVAILAGSGPAELGVSYQGCADAGLCYPPQTRWFPLQVAADGTTALAAPPSGSRAVAGSAGGRGVPATEEQTLASMLAGGSMWMALLVFFIGGVGLAFTPCVLPMVPILSSIIVGESTNITRTRALTLSCAYVLGMAVTYAFVGTLVGLFGASLNLQAALQAPPVLVFFAALFVVLSLAMFGFYELRLPRSWQDGLDAAGARVGGGKHLSVVVMGALSALVVSPCVSAPLAGALIYLSATGDAVLGGGALLALGIGMGVPLLLIGASGGHLLPRAGAWMNGVKAVFGVGLLAVAIWLLERVLAPTLTLALWAALAIGSGVYLGALDFSPRRGLAQLGKAFGALSFIYGVLLLVGAASGAHDPLSPLSELKLAGSEADDRGDRTAAVWHAVADLPELRAELAEAEDAGQLAMLDLYADWCISCKVLERSVFPRPEVDERLSRFRLLRADVTENNAADKELMNAFGLFGPPSLVFFAEGEELAGARIQGEVTADRLAAHLQALLDRHSAGDAVSAVERLASSP